MKVVVTNVEKDLARIGKRFLSKCVTPLSRKFPSWLEDSPELIANDVH